jgi:hypothetical protein
VKDAALEPAREVAYHVCKRVRIHHPTGALAVGKTLIPKAGSATSSYPMVSRGMSHSGIELGGLWFAPGR